MCYLKCLIILFKFIIKKYIVTEILLIIRSDSVEISHKSIECENLFREEYIPSIDRVEHILSIERVEYIPS